MKDDTSYISEKNSLVPPAECKTFFPPDPETGKPVVANTGTKYPITVEIINHEEKRGIKIHLDPDIEAIFRAIAQSRGITFEQYMQEFMETSKKMIENYPYKALKEDKT